MTPVNLACPRDVWEFVESKRVKREPLRYAARGAASAKLSPSSQREFSDLLEALKGNADFGRARERIEELRTELVRRDVRMPLAQEVIQNEDCSITITWADMLMVRFFPDGIAYSMNKVRGASQHVTPELIEACQLVSSQQG